MKKLFALLVIAGMVSFVACGPKGPSEADKKKTADSLKADSLAKVEKAQKEADSIAAAAKAQATADSLKADSIAKAEKKGGKKGGTTTPKTTTTPANQVKAGQGKG